MKEASLSCNDERDFRVETSESSKFLCSNDRTASGENDRSSERAHNVLEVISGNVDGTSVVFV